MGPFSRGQWGHTANSQWRRVARVQPDSQTNHTEREAGAGVGLTGFKEKQGRQSEPRR